MDTKYLNSLYDLHKDDSDNKLQKIVNTPDKYSQESVYVAKKILNERKNVLNNNCDTFDGTELNQNENTTVIFESIRRDINTIKNILIFYSALIIISILIIIFK